MVMGGTSSARGGVGQLTVKSPSDTVPTNLRAETPRSAIFAVDQRTVPRVVWLGVETRRGVEGGKNRVAQLETDGGEGGGLLDGVREGLAWQALAPEGTAWRKLGGGDGQQEARASPCVMKSSDRTSPPNLTRSGFIEARQCRRLEIASELPKPEQTDHHRFLFCQKNHQIELQFRSRHYTRSNITKSPSRPPPPPPPVLRDTTNSVRPLFEQPSLLTPQKMSL